MLQRVSTSTQEAETSLGQEVFLGSIIGRKSAGPPETHLTPVHTGLASASHRGREYMEEAGEQQQPPHSVMV